MVVNNGVLTMPIVHLTCLGCQLVQLNPSHLRSFSLKMTRAFNISTGEAICAVVFVVLNVEERNKPANPFDKLGVLGKVLQKAFDSVNRIPT